MENVSKPHCRLNKSKNISLPESLKTPLPSASEAILRRGVSEPLPEQHVFKTKSSQLVLSNNMESSISIASSYETSRDDVTSSVTSSLSELRKRHKMALHEEHKSNLKILYRYFSMWAAFVQRQKIKQKLSALADTFCYRKLLSKNYKVWKLMYRAISEKKLMAAESKRLNSQLRNRRHLLRNTFSQWRKFVEQERAKEAMQFKAEKLRRNIILGNYFRLWRRKKAEKMIKLHLDIGQFRLKWCNITRVSLLRGSFERWRQFAQLARRDRSIVLLLQGRRRSQLLSEYFRIWSHTYIQKNQFRHNLALEFHARLTLRKQNRILQQFFSHWKQLYARAKISKTLRVESVAFYRKKRVDKFFKIWFVKYEHAQKCKQNKADELCRTQQLARRRRILLVCFHGLLNNRLLCRKKRSLLWQAHAWRRKVEVRRCYYLWKSRWLTNKATHDRTCLALWHWSCGLKKKVVHAWIKFSKEKREQRLRHCEAAVFRKIFIQRNCIRHWILYADSVIQATNAPQSPARTVGKTAVGYLDYVDKSGKNYPESVYKCAEIWLRKWHRTKVNKYVSDERHKQSTEGDRVEQENWSVLDILDNPRSVNDKFKYYNTCSDNSFLLPPRLTQYITSKALEHCLNESKEQDCGEKLQLQLGGKRREKEESGAGFYKTTYLAYSTSTGSTKNRGDVTSHLPHRHGEAKPLSILSATHSGEIKNDFNIFSAKKLISLAPTSGEQNTTTSSIVDSLNQPRNTATYRYLATAQRQQLKLRMTEKASRINDLTAGSCFAEPVLENEVQNNDSIGEKRYFKITSSSSDFGTARFNTLAQEASLVNDSEMNIQGRDEVIKKKEERNPDNHFISTPSFNEPKIPHSKPPQISRQLPEESHSLQKSDPDISKTSNNTPRCPDFMKMSIERFGINLSNLEPTSSNLKPSANQTSEAAQLGLSNHLPDLDLQNELGSNHTTDDISGEPQKPAFMEIPQPEMIYNSQPITYQGNEAADFINGFADQLSTKLIDESFESNPNAGFQMALPIEVYNTPNTSNQPFFSVSASVEISSEMLMRPEEFSEEALQPRSSTPDIQTETAKGSQELLGKGDTYDLLVNDSSSQILSEIAANLSQNILNESLDFLSKSVGNQSMDHPEEQSDQINMSTQTEIEANSDQVNTEEPSESKRAAFTQTEEVEDTLCCICKSLLQETTQDVLSHELDSNVAKLTVEDSRNSTAVEAPSYDVAATSFAGSGDSQSSRFVFLCVHVLKVTSKFRMNENSSMETSDMKLKTFVTPIFLSQQSKLTQISETKYVV